MELRSSFAIMAFLLPLAAGAVGCGSASDSRPATWSYIYPVIIQPNCATATCHSALTQRFKLDLSTESKAWTKLKTYAIPVDNPAIVQLMHGELDGVQRMPPSFPLADADIELVKAWAAAGAAWDGPGAEPTK